MQSFKGTVVSTKMVKTVGVEIERIVAHPKYKKLMKKTTKLLAHNENPDLKVGDKVKIIKTMPYSKNVHFKIDFTPKKVEEVKKVVKKVTKKKKV